MEDTLLIVETTAGDPPVEFLGPSSDLVYFISFAHSERYGAQHPLAQAAAFLKRRLGIDLGPLLTFGSAQTEDEEDERLLQRLWQDPQPLAACASAVASAIDETPALRELTSSFPELPQRLRELAQMAAWAAARDARVRLTYVL